MDSLHLIQRSSFKSYNYIILYFIFTDKYIYGLY